MMRNMDEQRATVLIVDDAPENIRLLNGALMDDYIVKVATRGMKAIEVARSTRVDIILLDVMMPEMDGFETCRRLKADPLTRRIPVIFVTARDEVEDESVGFSCGGVDYITKPIRYPVVRARIKTHLALYDQKRALESIVRERTAELTETRREILNRLGRAAEYRDNETGMHVSRVCRYSRIIALEYGLPEEEAELLYNAAPMHDVGKIGIPDSILLKTGRLDEEEWRIIRSHCEIGYKIIGSHASDLLKCAAVLALTHHERWDGSGYPAGLKGYDIPVFSRVLAIADVFDALTSVRPYKKAWQVDEAVEEIRRCSGTHFEPEMVQAFLRRIPELVEIKEQFADPNEPDITDRATPTLQSL
ncbi:HD-GYP domain-containing protein [Geobacter sp. SVR]|uniref:HD-GYP domain-containing protein n=1 Tax=Geobacter sp. SVR TaxID=2495594 RepID=UPI00143EFEF5|nr:two-component system response regulator [Geobacter sp. SVR]BCS55030.1 two-component system response regulator [Geobacter sp. SVR]GCF85211.1 two-component system response regulator [Geobacter sp. SVR]